MKKNPRLKALLAIGAVSLIWSCSSDSSSFGNDQPLPPAQNAPIACSPAWYLQGLQNYVIYPDNDVTDDFGNIIGTAYWLPAPYDTAGNIKDVAGNIIVQQISKNTMPVIMAPNLSPTYVLMEEAAFHLKLANNDLLINPISSLVTDPTGAPVAVYDPVTGNISSLLDGSVIAVSPPQQTALLPVMNKFNKCATYTPPPPSSSSVTPPQSSSAVIPPQSSSVVPPKSSAITGTSSVGPTPKSSANPPPASSSSQPKSSAAATGGCPNIKIVNGGAKGNGWATRYWDCCKPSCSWQENSGGHPSRQCGSNGKNESTDWGAGSVCSGGPMATCTSQIPFTVNGCDEIAFAFAAVPASNGGQCGKCFQLTFNGTGKYSNDANIKKLKGKKLIVMATNIGGDVQQGQFDVMIPGGGVGMFNGCSGMGWNGQGEQYGGLLSDCEKETGYAAAAYGSCLTKKCNSAFGNDSQAKEGCMFLVNWMKSASNPNHDYVEVECPEVLKNKY